MFKKIASILTCVSFLLLITPIWASTADFPHYETGGMEFCDNTVDGEAKYQEIKNSLPKMANGSIPPRINPVKVSTVLYLNYRLWTQKGILVYGNYKCIPGNEENFKRDTQASSGNRITGEGYYLRNGTRGEYRYHGYDIIGNTFSNMNYIDDGSGIKFNERDWILKPWNNLPEDKRPYESDYNKTAMGGKIYSDPAIRAETIKWINKTLAAYNGVPLKGGRVDPDVYSYANVLSAPTTKRMGQVRMWHDTNGDEAGGIWYQTLSVPLRSDKLNLPVTAVISPLTPLNIKDIGTEMDKQPVALKFKVTATLNDTSEYQEPVKKTVYYTREDIDRWNITFSYPSGTGTATIVQNGLPKNVNTGSYVFTINTTYGYLRSKNWTLNLGATGQPSYNDSTKGNIDNANHTYRVGVTVVPPVTDTSVIVGFSPLSDIPETAFDGVPFTASDYTDMERVEKRIVKINGLTVDDNEFFSGSYVFDMGDVGVNGMFAVVDVVYEVRDVKLPEGEEIKTHDIVYVYPTKPIANFNISSSTWKQNRLIYISNTSNAGNIQTVVQKYPITQYRWSFGGDGKQLCKVTDTDLAKQLLYKEPGNYSLALECCNTLGKWSEPYKVDFEVLPDIGPAIGLNLSDSVTNRTQPVKAWFYEVVSTDGDNIASTVVDLWYDSDNNGMVDTKINSWLNPQKFPEYTPAKLGLYKYIVTCKENFTEDTLPAFISENDKKSSTYEVEFWCDNYRPMADIYINLPISRPQVDAFFMLDKNLSQAKTDYLLSNRMNMANWLVGKNILPNVQLWDMKTYTYSQPASTSSHTGSSYPDSSIFYTSNGYSGSLSRSSVANNQYSRDEGSYTTQTESRYFTATVTNTRSWTKNKYGIAYGSWSHSDYGSTYLINQDGYSGTIPRTGTSYSPSDFSSYAIGASGTQTATGYFGGTLTKNVQVWVPKIVWYNDYTGYYSGTITKSVRQPFTDPFSPTSYKYIVYISDSTVNELSDLQTVKARATDSKLIIAGTSGAASQSSYDSFIDVSGKSVDVVTSDILEKITDTSQSVEKYFVLQNNTVPMNLGGIDLENDNLVESGMQYVHDMDYFDNPTGREPETSSVFTPLSGWGGTVKTSFANTGRFEIYRRVRDLPSADTAFSSYSYYSGPSKVEVYVHRKPVAKASLDWDYNPSNASYKTVWVDQSYDPDHQYSREDKGIVERKIMWRLSGGEWNYGIPDSLKPGIYQLQYYVKDPEGVWSNPYNLDFTLSATPSIQFNASLRSKGDIFDLQSIPASELLEAFNLWTRYPYNVSLEMAIYNGGTLAAPKKSIIYSPLTGSKTGNDISWRDVLYTIPETLPDKAYTFKITSLGDYNQSLSRSFDIKLVTPVGLVPENIGDISSGTSQQVAALTTKYVNSCKATMFYGTAFQSTYDMIPESNVGGKKWTATISVPASVIDGTYTARFQAVTANGNTEYKTVNYRVDGFRISSVTIEGSWNHWRGQKDVFGKQLTNEPHRFLSLENVKVDVTTSGYSDKVVIRFSPELESMIYTDPKGNVYKYRDYVGYDVCFPPDTTFILDKTKNEGRIHWEYSLPLAPSTKSWGDARLKSRYKMTITAYKGSISKVYEIDDIDITGNIYDVTYIQPKK